MNFRNNLTAFSWKEVLAEFYPGVPFKREIGPNETLLSIEKARRVLGYEPHYSWRKEVSP